MIWKIVMLETVSGAHRWSYQTGTEALSSGIKQPDREADHLASSSAEIMNAWSFTYTPPYFFMAWCLKQHG
jgi:hypothetical protein